MGKRSATHHGARTITKPHPQLLIMPTIPLQIEAISTIEHNPLRLQQPPLQAITAIACHAARNLTLRIHHPMPRNIGARIKLPQHPPHQPRPPWQPRHRRHLAIGRHPALGNPPDNRANRRHDLIAISRISLDQLAHALPKFGSHLPHARRVLGDVIGAVLKMMSLGSGRLPGNRQSRAPLRRRANRPRRKPAAAVRANIEKPMLRAISAERAFVTADPRLRRGGRQVLVTELAVRP